jgi:NTP pyrophosphatase (non-canonical NTP hydrolase)
MCTKQQTGGRMDFEKLKADMLKFRNDRNWEQAHDSKNLAVALSIEASELLEHFLWVEKEAVQDFGEDKLTEISEEIADVFIYLFYMAHGLGVDIESAVQRKLVMNAVKYPLLN